MDSTLRYAEASLFFFIYDVIHLTPLYLNVFPEEAFGHYQNVYAKICRSSVPNKRFLEQICEDIEYFQIHSLVLF